MWNTHSLVRMVAMMMEVERYGRGQDLASHAGGYRGSHAVSDRVRNMTAEPVQIFDFCVSLENVRIVLIALK